MFLKQMEKDYNESIVTANEKVSVMSTGSLSLDVCTGIGGIPRGRFTEIYGSEGTGKTSICLEICKVCIENGGKALYIDVENLLDHNIIQDMLGVDFLKDKLTLVRPSTAEEAFDMAERAIQSEEFDVIIFDSIGAIAPAKEKEDDFNDQHYSLAAKLIAKFLRRQEWDLRTNNIAFIFTNQVRDKIGGYMNTFDTPGGHALKHQASLRISLTKGLPIKHGKNIIGIVSSFTIKKNKLAPPFKSATLPIIFGRGVDTNRNFIEFAKEVGIVDRKGAFYYFEDIQLGKGITQVMQTFDIPEMKETLDKIKERVYNMTNQILEVEDTEEILEE